MAAISTKNYHVRSNSLPTKPHPALSQAEGHLNRLRASETTTSSSSCSITSQKLSGLLDLHGSIDELLELTLTREAILKECSEEKSIAVELLEGSMRVVDHCGIARDLLVETKGFVQELQSILRRKGDKMGNIVSSDDLKNCLAARKVTKKAVRKTLKAIESKNKEKKQESAGVLGLLGEVEDETLKIVEGLLRSLGGYKSPLKARRSFSFVSKLVSSRRVEEEEREEVEVVDFALSSMVGHKTIKNQQYLQNVLDKLESSYGVLEAEIESLYRMLIRNRVSFLNILNH